MYSYCTAQKYPVTCQVTKGKIEYKPTSLKSISSCLLLTGVERDDGFQEPRDLAPRSLHGSSPAPPPASTCLLAQLPSGPALSLWFFFLISIYRESLRKEKYTWRIPGHSGFQMSVPVPSRGEGKKKKSSYLSYLKCKALASQNNRLLTHKPLYTHLLPIPPLLHLSFSPSIPGQTPSNLYGSPQLVW